MSEGAGKGQVKTIAIVGGGLVGALEAIVMARRQYKVDIYEMRPDIRSTDIVRGRSINMALSVRGREALRHVGMESEIAENGTPMYARMIHDLNGTRRPIPYGKKDQYIMSIDRRRLNEELITAAEKYPNVTLHFQHKLVSADLDAGTMVFQIHDGSTVTLSADLIIGCDGAYSTMRRQMMKTTLLDYQQIFIPHGYMELTMPPSDSDNFAMEVNYLHIWARNEYMMIALPNKDNTYTVTLFMPFDIFKTLTTEEAVLAFFEINFKDAIPLLGRRYLVDTVLNNKALPLVTVKCSPYHVADRALIMGDAAHAMVPFYGQGMNCGFEDCLVLNDLMNKHKDNIGDALEEFTTFRSLDAKAICDLALYNYVEMRKSVNSRMFLLRKKVDSVLHWLFPKTWIPLYTTVSFSRKRYHECILNREWQDKMISRGLCLGGVTATIGATWLAHRHIQSGDISIHDKVVDFVHSLTPWKK